MENKHSSVHLCNERNCTDRFFGNEHIQCGDPSAPRNPPADTEGEDQ